MSGCEAANRNKNLLILGAVQYGTVVKEIAQSMGCFEKIDFLDDSFGEDNPDYHEKSIGKIADAEAFCTDYLYAIPAIGNPNKRLELIKQLEESCFRVPVIVSPKAYVSPSAQLQKGVVVEPLAGVHSNTVVSTGTYISMGAEVNHNAVVADGCHIGSNAVVLSGVLIKPCTDVEPGTVVKNKF